MDTYLCNKRLLPKQGGDCVAWQINFPLPHTHLISHEALIQPLLSPLASADWLTYGIALFCFSSSPRSPENQTLPPVNLFWFLFGKESTASLFIHFRALKAQLNPLNQRDVSVWHNVQVVFYVNSNKQVWQCFVMRPPLGDEYLLLLVIYWGSYKSRLKCWHFQRLFRKCTKEFHSTLAKSTFTTCLWHQSYTRVSYCTPQ